jgi:hypothetical protein
MITIGSTAAEINLPHCSLCCNQMNGCWLLLLLPCCRLTAVSKSIKVDCDEMQLVHSCPSCLLLKNHDDYQNNSEFSLAKRSRNFVLPRALNVISHLFVWLVDYSSISPELKELSASLFWLWIEHILYRDRLAVSEVAHSLATFHELATSPIHAGCSNEPHLLFFVALVPVWID